MMMREKNGTKRGFTLVELLVVIGIVALLAAVALVYLRNSLVKARDAKRVAEVNQIEKSISIYFDSCGEYPDSLTLTTSNGCSGSDTLARFLPIIPIPPAGTDPSYLYAGLDDGVNPACIGYHIGITLENGGHSALLGDADAAAGTACGVGTDFTSTAGDAIYDVKATNL